MEDFSAGTILGIFLGICLTVVALSVFGVANAFTNGYCAGQGGSTITYNVCNVDGQVVEVPK